MTWVSSDGHALSPEMVDAIPLLVRLSNEVLVMEETHPTVWCADSGLPPPDRVADVRPHPGPHPAPLTHALAEWILKAKWTLNSARHRVTNRPLPAELAALIRCCPCTDLGVLLDQLDFLGRPLAFDVVVDAALTSLAEATRE